MQPYFLPYIGYWQLIAAADTFVILDDVNYINRGWINRNKVWTGGKTVWFTIPLRGASQNKIITDIEILPDDGWRKKMRERLKTTTARSPFEKETHVLIDDFLDYAHENLADFLFKTIKRICAMLEIRTRILRSSELQPKIRVQGAERIISICKKCQAKKYVNPEGGRHLYDSSAFARNNLELVLLKPNFDHEGACLQFPDRTPGSFLYCLAQSGALRLSEASRKGLLETIENIA